jgi:hypothetical protein
MQTLSDWSSPPEYTVLGYRQEIDPETGLRSVFQVRLSPLGDQYLIPVSNDGTLIYKTDKSGTVSYPEVRRAPITKYSRSQAAAYFVPPFLRTAQDKATEFMEKAQKIGATKKENRTAASILVKDWITDLEKTHEQLKEEKKNALQEATVTRTAAKVALSEATELSSVLAEAEADRAAKEAYNAEKQLRETLPYLKRLEYERYIKNVIDIIDKTAAAEAAEAEAEAKRAEYEALFGKGEKPGKKPGKEAAQEASEKASIKAFTAARTLAAAEENQTRTIQDFEYTSYLVDLLRETIPEKIKRAEETHYKAVLLQDPERVSEFLEAEEKSRLADNKAYLADQRVKELALREKQTVYTMLGAEQTLKYISDDTGRPAKKKAGGAAGGAAGVAEEVLQGVAVEEVLQ